MKLCIGLVFQSLFVTIVATTHTSFLRFCISNAPNPLHTRYDAFLGERINLSLREQGNLRINNSSLQDATEKLM